MYVCMYGWMGGWVLSAKSVDMMWRNYLPKVCMYVWMDGWMDGWVDGWMDD